MKKILTPPNLPGGVQSRILEIPSSKEWLGIFNTALYQTTRYWNYEQVNESDLSPQYVADICYDIFLKYLDSSYTKNDVPFWDDEDAADADADADDIANDPAYPWYEQVSDWIIRGFIAATFSPGAAVVYDTTIPRLRLALRKNDAGAIVRVLVDGVEAATVDTYSPTPAVATVDLDLTEFSAGGFHGLAGARRLKIEHTGTANPSATPIPGKGYALELIRKRLSEDESVMPVLNARQVGRKLQLTFNGVDWEDFATVLTETVADAGTNNVADVAAFTHDSVLTPSVGFGTGLRLRALDALSEISSLARWRAWWGDPLNRVPSVAFSVFDNGIERDVLTLARVSPGTWGVGINRTPRPGVALDVNGSFAADSFIANAFVAGSNFGLYFGDPAATQLKTPNPITLIFDTDNSGGGYFSVMRGGFLLGTATELFRIAANGDVGIMNSNPTSRLDVAGDIEIRSGDAYYLGDPVTDGTWRITRFADTLSFQKRITGNWVNIDLGGGGSEGRTPEFRSIPNAPFGITIQWKYTDEDSSAWRNLGNLNHGNDGASVDLRAIPFFNGRMIQWKHDYEDDESWLDLVNIQRPGFRVENDVLQWRYTGDEEIDWTDLYDFESGEPADPRHRCAVAHGLARGLLEDFANYCTYFYDYTSGGGNGLISPDTAAGNMLPHVSWLEFYVSEPAGVVAGRVGEPVDRFVYLPISDPIERFEKLRSYEAYASGSIAQEHLGEIIYCVLGDEFTLFEKNHKGQIAIAVQRETTFEADFWKMFSLWIDTVMTWRRLEYHAVYGAALLDRKMCDYNCEIVPPSIKIIMEGDTLVSPGNSVTIYVKMDFSHSDLELQSPIAVNVLPLPSTAVFGVDYTLDTLRVSFLPGDTEADWQPIVLTAINGGNILASLVIGSIEGGAVIGSPNGETVTIA
jgi:hypothetical protein